MSSGRSTVGAELRSPLAQDDYKALGDFRRALREFLAYSERGAREQGLTTQQHQALLAIKAHRGPEPITIGALAETLLIKNHSAIGLVARLVERDLVARRESAQDRRRVLVELRPKGEEALAVISLRNLGQIAQTGEILSEIVETCRRLERRGALGRRRAPRKPG